MMFDRSRFRIVTEVNADDAERLTERLVAFNEAHASPSLSAPAGEQALNIFIHDLDMILVGGLLARTHAIPYWLEITIIWIDERLQHQGLGRELIGRAEDEARRRGCRYARLATSHYQAPGFYRKLGYIQYGMLEDCPPGETVYYFRKAL
jgi:GNAT superfamily N-acetyltransferase